MARWSAGQNALTFVPVADATNYTSAGFAALQGGTSTQYINVLEVFLGGLSTASTPSQMVVARDSTVGATLTVGTFAALHPSTAALGTNPVAFSTASTKPQRSATLYLLTPAFNSFGGIVRWVAAPGEELGMLGNAASLGEMSISSVSGAAICSAHMIVEPF